MKKFFLLFAVLCCTMAANAQTQPANEIWYTSTDGQVVNPNSTNVFGATITSNLNSLVADEMAAINNATTIEIITENKFAALAKLSAAVPLYKTIKADAFGEMGTECEDCPAVEVTDGTTNLKLYNPTKVSFIKQE